MDISSSSETLVSCIFQVKIQIRQYEQYRSIVWEINERSMDELSKLGKMLCRNFFSFICLTIVSENCILKLSFVKPILLTIKTLNIISKEHKTFRRHCKSWISPSGYELQKEIAPQSVRKKALE